MKLSALRRRLDEVIGGLDEEDLFDNGWKRTKHGTYTRSGITLSWNSKTGYWDVGVSLQTGKVFKFSAKTDMLPDALALANRMETSLLTDREVQEDALGSFGKRVLKYFKPLDSDVLKASPDYIETQRSGFDVRQLARYVTERLANGESDPDMQPTLDVPPGIRSKPDVAIVGYHYYDEFWLGHFGNGRFKAVWTDDEGSMTTISGNLMACVSFFVNIIAD